MITSRITISNKLGLHARASAKLTKLAAGYKSDIHLARNGRRVNAKSIMGVMMLAAARGSTITIDTQGEGADVALQAIQELVADRFGEGE